MKSQSARKPLRLLLLLLPWLLLLLAVPVPYSLDDEMPVEVTRGRLDSYADGDPNGTLVKWMAPKGIGFLYSYSARFDSMSKTIHIDRYVIGWPFLALSLRRTASNFWIPSGRLGHSEWKIYVNGSNGYRLVGIAK